MRWDVPRGLTIRGLDLMLPDDKGRAFPTAPEGIRRLIAVSPFLDGGAVAAIGRWGDSGTNRSLLSTRPALAPLARQAGQPLKSFTSLLVLPATPESQETLEGLQEESTDVALEARGLHAKLLWAEHSGGATLWLGSANLTQRGWMRNAELVAEVEVERRGKATAAVELEEGISAFQDCGEEVKEKDLLLDAPDTATDLDRLEEARRTVAARLEARQILGGDQTVKVYCSAAPHPEDLDIKLSVGPVASALTEWPRGEAEIVLAGASGEAPTELLAVQLELNDETLSWTQRIAFDPPLSAARLDQRDASVLADWLGAAGMLAAIRGLLDGTSDGDGDGGRRWDDLDEPGGRGPGSRGPAPVTDAPTLEQALKAWMRDPRRLALVDQLLAMWPRAGTDRHEQVARARLDAFRRTWTTLRASLREESNVA